MLENKINYLISSFVTILSAILGEFWFLFIFLLMLNIIDYITGLIKARYLKKESSKKAFKGMMKKIFIWFLITIAFGIGISLAKLGELVDINLEMMKILGIFMLVHSILNEIRSILENITQCGKGYLIPSWLISGLEVAQDISDNRGDNIVKKIKTKGLIKKYEDK